MPNANVKNAQIDKAARPGNERRGLSGWSAVRKYITARIRK
jgi:hypothetical protein